MNLKVNEMLTNFNSQLEFKQISNRNTLSSYNLYKQIRKFARKNQLLIILRKFRIKTKIASKTKKLSQINLFQEINLIKKFQ